MATLGKFIFPFVINQSGEGYFEIVKCLSLFRKFCPLILAFIKVDLTTLVDPFLYLFSYLFT